MVHRLARHLGAHLASLHRFDALIFTGGIGENSALIRELTAERLAIFGVQLDAARNAQMFAGRQGIISRPGSPIVAVIATNEERMIAEDAAALAPCWKAPPERVLKVVIRGGFYCPAENGKTRKSLCRAKHFVSGAITS
jgi:hypothetical protein